MDQAVPPCKAEEMHDAVEDCSGSLTAYFTSCIPLTPDKCLQASESQNESIREHGTETQGCITGYPRKCDECRKFLEDDDCPEFSRPEFLDYHKEGYHPEPNEIVYKSAVEPQQTTLSKIQAVTSFFSDTVSLQVKGRKIEKREQEIEEWAREVEEQKQKVKERERTLKKQKQELEEQRQELEQEMEEWAREVEDRKRAIEKMNLRQKKIRRKDRSGRGRKDARTRAHSL